MAEYVAEMATRLALGNVSVSPSFRKFVSQILTSTRLPSTTILLGMNYMAKRINIMTLGNNQRVKFTEGQVWRMLTTSFLLGSKFLDDNTFQNRSWSEVSGIAVRELNTLEQEWLEAINWNLYVNLDRSKDYNAWLKSWHEWQGNRKRQQAQATRERLMPVVPPIDTDVHRTRAHGAYALWHQQQVAEYERLQSLNLKRTELSPQSSMTSNDNWYSARLQHWGVSSQVPVGHPITPPDSGYGTPEYLNSAPLNSAASHNSQYPANDWFTRGPSGATYSHPNQYHQRQHQHQAVQQPPQQQPQLQSQMHQRPYSVVDSSSTGTGRHHSSSHHGYYGYASGHSIWDHNVSDCTGTCASAHHMKPAPYGFGMTHGYGQPVMG